MENVSADQLISKPPRPSGMQAWEHSNLTLRQFRFWMLQAATPELPIERFLRVILIAPSLAIHLDAVWAWFSQAADAARARLVVDNGIPRLVFESTAEPVMHAQLDEGDDPATAAVEWVERTGWAMFRPGDRLHRHALLTMTDGRLLWATTANHLASDGRSGNLQYRHMADGLLAMARGEPLPTLQLLSFADNMAEERARELNSHGEAAQSTWSEWLTKHQVPFSLFGIHETSASITRPVGQATLSTELVTQLAAVCQLPDYFHRSVDITMANLFTALMAVWVWRHGGHQTQVIAVPFHGRTAAELNMIGFKSEILPLRIDLDPEQSFAALLQSVHAEARNSLTRRGQSIGNPLHAPNYGVVVSFNYQAAPTAGTPSDLERLHVEKHSGSPEFLNLSLTNSDTARGGMDVVMRFRPEITEQTEAVWLASGLHEAIRTLVQNPGVAIRDLCFPDAVSASRIEALATVDCPQVDHRWISRWQSRLADIGGRDALTHDASVLTHHQLADAAGRWLAFLGQQGLAKGDRVVMWMPTSNAMSAAWLGLMAAGGVHVPVHHDTPPDRVRELVENIGARFVMFAPELDVSRLIDVARCIRLDAPEVEALTSQPLGDPDPDALAHIFHTSGSTGIAKPIMVSHRALAASIHGWIKANRMQDGERIFHFYATTFDPWLTGIIPALWLGGTCITREQTRPPAADELLAILEEHRVSTLCTPTAYFHALCDLQIGPSVRRWVVGGEALAADKAMRFLRAQDTTNPTRLVNAYGPTETTIWACIVEADARHQTSVPIGRPLPTCGFRVADASGHPVPFGVPGELWITGPQVAEGYSGQPELTARQFVMRDSQCWYRTGDVVRLRKDGDLDYLGRSDRQVQIRGYRVEPGEIEIALRAVDGVKDALVVPVTTASTTALGAYIIHDHSDTDVDAQALRIELLRSLPEYKVPRWFIGMTEFPSNHNGKVDMSALPKLTTPDTGPPPDRLPTLTLWDLRLAFEEVLQLPRVGIDEDFFSLGGDSLLLVELIASIERRFGRTLEPIDVVRHPTVGGLAPLMETGRAKPGNLVVALQTGSLAPLFCIPGAGGIGVEFYALSRRLPSHQPVIVLRSSGTDGHSKPPASIELLLAEHERNILDWRAQQSETRPVQLMGYSLGGIFAYEVARRLQARGIPVAGLYLIDAHVATEAGWALFKRNAPSLRQRVKSLLKRSPNDVEQVALERELERAIGEDRIMEASRLGRLNLLCQAKLARDIHSVAADLPATYFLASRGPRREHAELWKQLIGQMEIEVIEGDHDGDLSIVREPNVARLSQALQQRLGV